MFGETFNRSKNLKDLNILWWINPRDAERLYIIFLVFWYVLRWENINDWEFNFCNLPQFYYSFMLKAFLCRLFIIPISVSAKMYRCIIGSIKNILFEYKWKIKNCWCYCKCQITMRSSTLLFIECIKNKVLPISSIIFMFFFTNFNIFLLCCCCSWYIFKSTYK